MADYRRSDRNFFVNPYNFVSINTRSEQREDIKKCYSGKEQLHTGYLQCKIIVKTPLAIPDSERKVQDGEHSSYPFYSIDGEKVIPGASIRGILRSVYEAATDSCMVTVKESMGMTARIDNKSAYAPGLLIREQDEWKLYKAKRYLIPVKGYKKFCTAGTVLDAGICVETQGGKRCLKAENGEYFSNGACVEFQLFPEPQPYNKRGYLVWNGVVQDMHTSKKGNAYVYIGEKFGNKHGESLFQKTGLVKKEQKVIDKAMKGLEETLKVYRDAAINREYGKAHSGYQNYEEARRQGVIPVWYQEDKQNKTLYFSAASIGRMQYENTLSDLIGKKKPCENRNSVCKACSLFGMAAKNEAIGSRVRIGDAIGKDCTVKRVTLQELGMPRSSYMPFYAEKVEGRRVTSCKSYDEMGAGIRGRKFYWHNPAAAEDESVYATEKKTERNATMELVMPGAEFDFRVYYDEITQQQLEELIWSITFWENERNGELCHKLGHGKPLGLGSVKMIVTEKVERSTDLEGYRMETGEITFGEAPVRTESTAVREILKICNFNTMKDRKVCYPYVEISRQGERELERYSDRELGENVLANHQWFTQNKGTRRDAPEPCSIVGILQEEQGLPIYFVENFDERRDLKRKENGNEKEKREKGQVKFFNTEKNFGFISMEDGREVFLHGSSVDDDSISRIERNAKVEFVVKKGKKGLEAKSCKVIEA